MMVIAVSIDIICIMQFYDDSSCVTQLIWKTVSLDLKYDKNLILYVEN